MMVIIVRGHNFKYIMVYFFLPFLFLLDVVVEENIYTYKCRFYFPGSLSSHAVININY